MGWDFTQGAKKSDIVKDLVKESETYKTIAHKVKGNILWAVQENKSNGSRLILCALLENKRKYGWGYKDMTHNMHPYYYNCPLPFVRLLSENDFNDFGREWLSKVLDYNRKLETIKEGAQIYLKKHLQIPSYLAKVTDAKITQGEFFKAEIAGKLYKVRVDMVE